jgi:hypothetical protein
MKKILLVLSVTLSLFVSAQNNGTKIKFQKGQKLEITTETKKNATMELMGQSMDNNVTSTVTEMFDIEDVNESGATIEYKVKRLVIDASGMGKTESFDSEKEGDRKGELGKLLEKGIKNKFTMKVDNYGKIISIKADDDNPNATKTSAEDEAMGAMISSQLGVNVGMPKEGDNSIFKILPEKTVVAGDTWNVATDANGQKKSTTYKVNSISDADILLDYNEEVTINTKQQMMGTEATVTGNEKSTGTITLDKTSGILKSKTISKQANTNLEAQGMTLPTTEKTTITVTVKVI